MFAVALGLGLTSFGGPIAHIGYFERCYVARRKWLSGEEFAGLVALCQLVPGPTSSQLGYLIGLRRAGWGGALAAWLGFTLPSALLMFGFALLAPALSGPLAAACLHGLKLVAVVIVAQAVLGMARTLCPDIRRRAIAVLSGAALLLVGRPDFQLLALSAGAVLGTIACRNLPAQSHAPALPIGPRTGAVVLAVFLALLAIEPSGHGLAALAAVFYRSGALVFGGGHVMLPLLQARLVPAGWLTDSTFLAGYGAAQAMPGPLFAFAAYLGATIAPPHAGLAGQALWSATATVAIFLPGLLIAPAALSVWQQVSHHAAARGALAGINAAVVGILGAAFCNPVWTGAIRVPTDPGIAAIGLLLMLQWRIPPAGLVALCLAAALAQSRLGLA